MLRLLHEALTELNLPAADFESTLFKVTGTAPREITANRKRAGMAEHRAKGKITNSPLTEARALFRVSVTV